MNIDYFVPFISLGVCIALWAVFIDAQEISWWYKIPVGILLTLWLAATTIPFLYWIK